MRWQLDAHEVAPATCTLQVDCAWLFASSIFPFPLSLWLHDLERSGPTSRIHHLGGRVGRLCAENAQGPPW